MNRKFCSRVAVLATALLFATASVRSEQVVFSEVMYHPPGTLPEYIEVFNNTATPFDIAEWRLRDGVDYDFPVFASGDPTRTFLKPFERILLTSVDAATLRTAYNVPANVRIYGPWTGNLDSAGERVTLKDKNDVVVCTLSYNDRGHWPLAADGAGHSLILKNSDKRIDDWRNWTFSQRRLGTPGTEPVQQAETPVASPEVNLDEGLPFVNYGDSWRFNDANTDLGTAWRAPAFDDSAWAQGPGLFGIETAPLPSPGILTPFAGIDRLTYYLRTRFVYNGPINGVIVSIDQIIDDGAVYYLNGVEVGRSGMPAGGITFATVAARTVSDATEELNVVTVPGSALVNGTNVLAVEVHQVSTTSSDVVFGARLKVSVPNQPSVVINEVLPGPTGTGFVEFFNPGGSAINLRNHYLTDDPANLTRFRVLTDVNVPAGGLASIGFAESSLAVASPVKVYLVAPDGVTVINAVNATMALDGRSIGRKPTGGATWFLFADPTRGAPNASQSSLAASLRVNEVHFSPTNTVDWVELHNSGSSSASLDGLFLSARSDFADKVPLSGLVVAGGHVSRDLALPVSDGEVALFLINGSDAVLWARLFSRPVSADSAQAFPNGGNEWYFAATSSRDAANNPPRQTNVVINEIMGNHAPSDEPAAEFIELYNRGTNAVDLSGWSFTDGVRFTFPPGTELLPDGYLVIAADEAWMRAEYGAIPVVGNFDGPLRNTGELVRLVDALGNLADEVDYLPGGNWPRLANGDGTSMELRNPWMDNELASAWADSNETNKAPFVQYSYSDVYRQLRADGVAADHKELHLHLVGDSHVVLRNIQIRQNGAGANLILNGNAMSTSGTSANGWLAQGTHYATYLQNGELNIIADGHGDNRPNRVENDATGLTANQTYEISFEARWVAGASRVIAQTWDHSIGTTFSLPVPRNLGTPGFQNSRFTPMPAPQVDSLLHSPAVPAAGQAVRITAAVRSLAPSPQVRLYHRLDNNTGSGAWSNKPMFDDGSSGGDVVAGDGIYTAQLTEYGAAGQVAQFYVLATANNQSSHLPSGGARKPAMYVVDTPTAAGDLRRMRFVMSALDVKAIADQDSPTPPYGYAFPRLNNHYFNMTLIINERDIIYNCEMRNSGSPWTRGGDLSRGKYKLPKDQLFRGKEKFNYDNDAAGGSRHHNRISRHWLYLLGHPGNENEYIQVEVNNGGVALREETEPLGNDMMDRIYDNGSQGELYRIDDEWWFQDNWSRSQRDADWSYKGSDNAVRYHTEWMKRTRENDYDYSSLIGLFRKINTGYTQAEIERLVDPDAVMQMSAVRGYTGDWDSFSLNRGKNGYLYRRPTDGRFMFFHWDSDLAFQGTGEVFYNGMVGFRPYLTQPYNFRLFKHYLAQMVQNYTRNSARINAWLQAEEDASTQYTVSSAYQTWFTGRESGALALLGAARTNVFDITSNGGNAINAASNTVNLAGVAPLRVFRVEVAGHPEAIFAWTSETGWTLSGIILRTGANVLTLNAVDRSGVILLTDTITVNKTGNAPPVMALEANPDSWHVSVLEPLEIDASASYDPDGMLLTFAWAANPADAQIDASGQDNATVFFPRPGLYAFTVTGTDAGGATNTIQREAAVYAPDGFSPFNQPRLDAFWNLQNLSLRRNHLAGAYYSLNEVAGSLLIQVPDDRAYPLASATPLYPFLWRSLPALTDWAFLTKVGLNAQVFGDYMAGAMAEIDEGGSLVRYAFGIEDGTLLNVRRITSAGTSTTLRSIAFTRKEAAVRIRRTGNTLFFEQLTNGVWAAVHSAGLPANSSAAKVGLFLATDTPQRIKAVFDHAILVDPSATSDLRESLRISEIMYNPVGGSEYEFVELVNIGAAPLDLTGVQFTAGIDYTFGPTTLGPKQYLVVVKNQALFASRYNVATLNVAPGIFGGRLDNAGETIELSDRNGVVFLSVTYGTTDPWPAEADGSGSSLEARDTAGNLNDPNNWRASPEAGGSPGRAGGDALGSVIVNEALSHTDAPLEDTIEVFNRTGQPIDIGGWFLSDSKADFKKFRIPANTIVPPGGFRVFYEVDFNSNNLVAPFSLSSANGDQVHLSAADAAGNLTGYRSSVDFGAAANGVSFGRYETTVGRDFTALTLRTFGADSPATFAEFRAGNGLANAGPRVGPVVINEIMYRPPDIGGTNDNSADEFVEVFNLTGSPVELFDVAFPTNTWRLRGGADLDFPTNLTLAARGYLLIVNFNPVTNAAALAAFRALYGVPVNVPILGPYQGKLSNNGEELKLSRPDAPQTIGPDAGLVPYIVVDKVTYSDGYPWPSNADGAGDSLQRRRAHDHGNDPVNWKSGGPTAGRANVPGASYADTDADGMADSFEQANGFSPNDSTDANLDADGDGRTNYEEFLDGTNPLNNGDRLIIPVITAQPLGQSVAAGASVNFSVTATGTAPLFYQWRFNGTAINGATNSTLALPNVQPPLAGEYVVVVRNAAGFAFSGGAGLSVSQALTILAQPQSRIADVGGSASFTVFAAGTGTLRYQWRFNGGDIASATNSSLMLSSIQVTEAGNYSVVVSDGSSSLPSADATLAVLSPPVILQQPQNLTAVAYSDAFFSVEAGGEGPFTYQWRFNGLNIVDATNSILALPNVQINQAGTYRVQVFNPVSSVLSSNAALTLLIPASITQQPQSTNVAAGGTATFAVVATSSTPLRYQWRFNDVDIPGATNSILIVLNAQEDDAGNYVVVVSDSIGSVSSQVALLGIIIPLSFTQMPLSQAVVEGGSVTLSVEINGGPMPFGFEWRKGSVPVASNTVFSFKNFFTLSNVQPADAAGYRVVVKNAANQIPGVASNPLANLTVLPDFDRDGLPDVLEQAWGLNTNNVADALGDLDGDGVSNRKEYVAGTDPLDPASYLWVDGAHGGGLTTIWFPAASNRTYTVEYTDNLGGAIWSRLEDLVARGTNHVRVITDPQPTGQRMYRVVTPRRP